MGRAWDRGKGLRGGGQTTELINFDFLSFPLSPFFSFLVTSLFFNHHHITHERVDLLDIWSNLIRGRFAYLLAFLTGFFLGAG